MRVGRPLHRYRSTSARVDANAGGTAEGLAFRPSFWEERRFCCPEDFYLIEGVFTMKEQLAKIEREALEAITGAENR